MKVHAQGRSSLQILAILILASISAAAKAPNAAIQGSPKDRLHVYLLIGQSNMGGRGAIDEAKHVMPSGVFLLNAEDRFETATHPLNKYSTIGKEIEKQRLNIGYSFAKSMREAQPGVAIGLVVNARGGSGIEQWARGTDYYNEAIRRAQAAAEKGTLKGILWHQGERNSSKPEGYDLKLAQLIEDFRKDFGDPTLPFVAGQIIYKPGTETVNAMIADLPNQVPYTGYVSAEGLTTFEKWHFDSPSLIALGEGYAREMLRIAAQNAR